METPKIFIWLGFDWIKLILKPIWYRAWSPHFLKNNTAREGIRPVHRSSQQSLIGKGGTWGALVSWAPFKLQVLGFLENTFLVVRYSSEEQCLKAKFLEKTSISKWVAKSIRMPGNSRSHSKLSL